jgi:uracil-DNA glycosylase
MSKSLSKEERFEALKSIRDRILVLKDSELSKDRIKNKTLPVIGSGSHFADVMCIGEAPGKKEAETGVPFCGRSGKILDELLDSVGMNRDDVYVTNIVKDRPPKNRDPKPAEIEMYVPFLDEQIEIIQPKVIATLGRFAMSYIMKHFGLEEEVGVISDLHGKEFKVSTSYGEVTIVPLFHPAVAVYNMMSKDALKKDFKVLKKFVK